MLKINLPQQKHHAYLTTHNFLALYILLNSEFIFADFGDLKDIRNGCIHSLTTAYGMKDRCCCQKLLWHITAQSWGFPRNLYYMSVWNRPMMAWRPMAARNVPSPTLTLHIHGCLRASLGTAKKSLGEEEWEGKMMSVVWKLNWSKKKGSEGLL